MTIPTAAALKARYPEMDGVGNTLVDAVIADAAAYVDDTWREGDRSPAILALAAHMLSVEGEPHRTNTGGIVNGSMGAITSTKVGDVTTTFAGVASGGAVSMDGFNSTSYGLAFLRLRRRNFPAVAVV
jgi:hypothetical protein